MIQRWLQNTLENNMFKGKAIILVGARQTGKTTLLKSMFSQRPETLWLNADEPDISAMFDKISSSRLKTLFGKKQIIIIDEAQRISDIGLKLKLITDEIKEIQLIATGSSAFELANKVNEPLTGRKWESQLFPLSFSEMVSHHGLLEEKRLLTHRLVYGYYPEVVISPGKEREVLKQLTDSFLYKDILMWERIKKPEKLTKLLQALAFQVGSEVSYHGLGVQLGMDNQTIENYITLLEQTYVIFRLQAFSRNHRKELKRGRKIYFFDNGIRNALIANFSPMELRNDAGALWENFIISERHKFLHYQNIWSNSYFWRTQDQQEIDYIEDRDGILYAYEFKWNNRKMPKLTKSFSNHYTNYQYKVIHPNEIDEFLLP